MAEMQTEITIKKSRTRAPKSPRTITPKSKTSRSRRINANVADADLIHDNFIDDVIQHDFVHVESGASINVVDAQNRAYYESLEKDMEKDIAEQIAEIDRQTKLKEIQEELEKQKEINFKIEELAKIEKEKNQPSSEELRQRRLKFYEK